MNNLSSVDSSCILVVQRRMTHYRVPFFNALRDVLSKRGLRLVVAYGVGAASEANKSDSGELDWGVRLDTRYFLGERICWQPFGDVALGAGLVVIALENKLIYNLSEQFSRRGRKVALWGHGANLQGDPCSFRERFKRVVARRADWWFGYTEMSRPLIERSGFPRERVTILNNSVDTTALRTDVDAVSNEDVEIFRREHGLGGSNVGLYLGSLYAEKRIDFLLSASERIKQQVADFELVVVGGGEDRALVEAFCERHAWARYLGPLSGHRKAVALRASRILLNPGLVGLGILDSFVAGVPMVTTDCGLHSPEIAYLKSGENGLMTEDSERAFVDAVSGLLRQPEQIDALRDGCVRSAALYTVESMAANFADGVERCLEQPVHRWRK
jgi:glycosyltransferase involved in cell wall biosynthesis